MMTKMTIWGMALVLILGFCDVKAQETKLSKNAEKAVAILQAIESGNAKAMQEYLDPNKYIQHNLYYPDGATPVIGATQSGAFKGTTVETYRIFTDNDIVVLHSQYGGSWNGGKPQAAFDVFRFEKGLIVEHWDNLTDVKDDGDGTTQFNGEVTPAADLKKTKANRALINETSQKIFIEGLYSTIGNYFDTVNYVQHSVGFGTDIQPLLGFLSTLPEGTPFYQSIEFIHVEGNFALMMSQGYPDKETGVVSAYFDLFRLESGKIVEHWDVVQAIPSKSDWKNNNGKY